MATHNNLYDASFLNTVPPAPIMSIPSMFPPSSHAQLPNLRNPGFPVTSSMPYHCNGQTQDQQYHNGEYRITREHNSAAVQFPSLTAAHFPTPAVPSTAAATATATTAADDVVLMNLDTGNLVRDQQPNYTHKCDKCPFGAMDEMSLRMHYLQEHYDVGYMRDHIKKHYS